MESFNVLLQAIESYVVEYMSRYDSSHDFNHVKRVQNNALHILSQETRDADQTGLSRYDRHAVILASVLHDVGDRKYAKAGENAESLISEVLLRNNCPPDFATKVVAIVQHVSYSNEIRRPEAVRAIRKQYPELDIVQDADRLDAIGAIGIARTFTYGGAVRPDTGLDGTLDHFTEKLERLEGMMKTETGRQMARERTERLTIFRRWFLEEATIGT